MNKLVLSDLLDALVKFVKELDGNIEDLGGKRRGDFDFYLIKDGYRFDIEITEPGYEENSNE